MAILGAVGLVVVIVVGVAVAMTLGKGEPPAPVEPPKPKEGPKALDLDPAAGKEEAPVGTGIDKRASAREARSAAAAKALQEAKDFASKNPEKAKEAAEKFRAVADEYAELQEGRQAKDEHQFWSERALSRDDREKRDREREEAAAKRAKEVEDGLRKVDEAIAGLRFGEALGALQEIDPPEGKKDHWKWRGERLNLLIGFSEMLHEGLQGSPVNAFEVRSGLGKPAEKIVGASADGLALRGPSGDRTVPWAEVKPADVVALSRKVLRNAPDPRLALACYCWETGLRDEAAKEMDVALLTDRTGTVPGRIEEIFGPEDRRQ
jgi:hypothetical protein